jgi:hypothetical protein
VYLERAEGKTRKQVEALLPATPGKQQPATNVTEITKKKNGE